MAATKIPSALEKLREPFPLDAVKQRQGGGGKKLDYVAIETVLARLLEVVPEYSWVATRTELIPRAYTVDGDEKVTYTAFVCGDLSAQGKTATGVGAMVNPDPDMALKSANTEAMKNAAKNGFGVGLELWDAEYRTQLEKRRKLAGASEAALKQEVFRLATERLGKKPASAKEAAGAFGKQASALASEEGLRSILTDEGVL